MHHLLAAADALAQLGFDPLVLHFPVETTDDEALANCLRRYSVVATIEEHSRIGGFGAAIAEWASDMDRPNRLLRFGTRMYFTRSGWYRLRPDTTRSIRRTYRGSDYPKLTIRNVLLADVYWH